MMNSTMAALQQSVLKLTVPGDREDEHRQNCSQRIYDDPFPFQK